MNRFYRMTEHFILQLLSLRLLMRHGSGDVTQAIAFVRALNPFACYLNFVHTLKMGKLTPIS